MTTRSSPTRLVPSVLFLVLALAAPGAWAQDTETKWPELAKKDEPKITLMLRRVESGSEEEAANAITELVKFGPAVAPTLLRKLALPRQPRHLVEGMITVLDRVVTTAHAPLVVRACDERSLPTQRWAVQWLGLHADEQWRPVFDRFAHPPTDPKPKEEPDPELVFLGNLGLAALKDTEALLRVIDVCHTQWLDRGAIVGRILPAARSAEMAKFVIGTMRADDERSRVTGLRMLRSLAPKDYAGAAAVYLDAGESSVKKEAINALRAIVDGAPALEELSVFAAIEQAKKWKERLK